MDMTRSEIEKIGLSRKNTPFSEILLNGGDRNKLSEALEQSGWNNKENDSFDVKVLFNGVEISAVDFNTIVGDWWNRMGNDIKKKVDYYKTSEAVENKAKELVKDKLEALDSMMSEFKNSFGIEE